MKNSLTLLLVALLVGCGASDLSAVGQYTAVLFQEDRFTPIAALTLEYDDAEGCVTLTEMTARVNGVEAEVVTGRSRPGMTNSGSPIYYCEHPSVVVPHVETVDLPVVVELSVHGEIVLVEAVGYGKTLPAEVELPEGGARAGGTLTLVLGPGWERVDSFGSTFASVEGHPSQPLEFVELSDDGRLTVRLPADMPAGTATIRELLGVTPDLTRCEGAPACELLKVPQTRLSVTFDVVP